MVDEPGAPYVEKRLDDDTKLWQESHHDQRWFKILNTIPLERQCLNTSLPSSSRRPWDT